MELYNKSFTWDFYIKFFQISIEKEILIIYNDLNKSKTKERNKRNMKEKGILLPIFSLPSKYGIGDFGYEAYQFIDILSENNIKMWIRQVLVPGYTDDENDLLKLKDFINSLKTVEKIEILPYHSMGKYKWKKLGFKYELENVPEATSKDVERVK